MSKTIIGLLREGKIPVDKRTPLTPSQAKAINAAYPDVEVIAQRSEIRCFTDEEYVEAGIRLVDSVEEADILLGVKEVPIPDLIEGKTYFFFSHTIKKQPYNRDLLREILKKNIRMVDYETLTEPSGKRIIAFGRWAGIVGAYNGIWTYGKRYNLFDMRRANECFDLEDLKTEFSKVILPPIKIALTGGGRVTKGAMEVLTGMGIRKVTPHQFCNCYFDFPVYTQLNVRNYNAREDGEAFSRNEFYKSPQNYVGDFLQFTSEADILIAAAFWAPEAPVLFTKEDMTGPDFKTSVIADITCDIEGSIPSTKQPSTIADPVYDYNPSDDEVDPPFTDEGNISVMAVDNLPCELPRDASSSFGQRLADQILPLLLGEDPETVIERATIASEGKLCGRYTYLQDYVDGE
ncbi:NAD(P)-dependent oxidoreductase [Maridesulfovibrio zosterae]|uniref:NAD(P)-dependent oxidoreductase n=1 Tax=Maridesulfovibrio zosterae TaxID=82171 RepID=UPI0004286E0A|nr:NAD(P)-dependent oxidoreductase [Maridesulfovibrio zosterae]